MTASLEDLRPGTSVGGVVPGKEVTAVALGWHGTTAVTPHLPGRRRPCRRAPLVPVR
jgi:hypothetical protein